MSGPGPTGQGAPEGEDRPHLQRVPSGRKPVDPDLASPGEDPAATRGKGGPHHEVGPARAGAPIEPQVEEEGRRIQLDPDPTVQRVAPLPHIALRPQPECPVDGGEEISGDPDQRSPPGALVVHGGVDPVRQPHHRSPAGGLPQRGGGLPASGDGRGEADRRRVRRHSCSRDTRRRRGVRGPRGLLGCSQTPRRPRRCR